MRDHYGELRHDMASICDRVPKEICISRDSCSECKTLELYKLGYRKQSEGEWEQSGLSNPKCSLCRTYNYEKSNYCPNCGARMKGQHK